MCLCVGPVYVSVFIVCMYVYKYFVLRVEMTATVKERKSVCMCVYGYVQIMYKSYCQTDLSMNVTDDEFKFLFEWNILKTQSIHNLIGRNSNWGNLWRMLDSTISINGKKINSILFSIILFILFRFISLSLHLHLTPKFIWHVCLK